MRQDFVFPLSQGLSCDLPAVLKAGEQLHANYEAGEPFSHIQIDNFLDPEILERVLQDIDALPPNEESYRRAQENLKRSFQPDGLPTYARDLFSFFNSRSFSYFLEKLTGINGLIVDQTFLGAGIHEVKNGGHLSIHADFNIHPALQLERRINVLIYLNKDWKPEYGGQFEIWDKTMTHCVKRIDPVFNRCVIFNTASDSYHGNPTPVNHPDGRSRYSIALYYYTATWDGLERSHATLFKRRPGSTDAIDWLVLRKELTRELLPPFVARTLKRVVRGALARIKEPNAAKAPPGAASLY